MVPKLEDANLAGGPQASACTLIVTEGDSAKALAVSGLSIVGRDCFGVFPLRGKVLNVRDATPAQLASNDTIAALKAILGLRDGAQDSFLKKGISRGDAGRSVPSPAADNTTLSVRRDDL